MKKLLVVLISLAMAFCMFGCGQNESQTANDEGQSDTYNAIPLGGELGYYELSGIAVGEEYSKIDTPDLLNNVPEGCSVDTYYCADCDTPYIVVYRTEKNDRTLDEYTKSISEEFGVSIYEIFERNVNGENVDCGYFQFVQMNAKGLDEECYYVDCSIMEDGEDFVEIDFYAATEEIQLDEELNQYLWVPKGYDVENNNKYKEMGAIFDGVYDESYYLPEICIASYEPGNYESELNSWSYYFPEGVPFTKAQYDKWVESEWNNGADEEYYDALGLEINNTKSFELNGAKITKYSGDFKGKKVTDGYIDFGDKCFNVWVETELDPAPHFGIGLLSTLHSR